jgi:hypothetical protein
MDYEIFFITYKTHFVYKLLCYYMFPLQRTSTHLVRAYIMYQSLFVLSYHCMQFILCFFRNYQTELKCEAKVTNYDAQSDTKKVCMSHNAALDMSSV